MSLLTKRDALDLLKKYKVDERVMEHLWAVHDYAMEIASQVECDRDLVEVGSLLHDIGRSKSHNIDHALIGAVILRIEGVDEKIVKIVERHTGAGLTPDEAIKLGLPPGDYVPKTTEEKIVCHADNLIGSTERVSIKDTIKMARQKWFPASVDRLIQMHFEVFRPVDLAIDVESKGNNHKTQALESSLDKLLVSYDVLYKIRNEGKKCIISLYGQDATKAKEYLMKHKRTLQASDAI